jgi:hypothetical protein
MASVYALGLLLAVAMASPAAAKIKHKPAANDVEHASKEPFGDIPKGPVQIIVSINQQKLHLYSDGTHVADTSIASGVPKLPTPTGVFSVIQKQRYHESNLYSNAPMPFMQRITWSGVAMHEGENIGHPASHGCIRMPRDFAIRLYGVTKLGVRVIVARTELKLEVVADPHLFVHKAAPPPVPAPVAAEPAPAPAQPIQTAQTNDDTKTTDAGAAPPKSDAPAAADANAPALVAADANAPAPSSAAPSDQPAPQPTATADADKLRGTEATPTLPPVPAPAASPAPAPAAPASTIVETGVATHGPISVFVSRKTKRIYVRQNFTPLFEAPITIAQPEQAFGTLVFTAMDALDDTTFRWNVVVFPGEPAKVKREADDDRRAERHGRRNEEREKEKAVSDPPPPQTPAQVLARIDIPQDVIDRIDSMMTPASSLVVSDQGLGDETGEGTDFIVVTR